MLHTSFIPGPRLHVQARHSRNIPLNQLLRLLHLLIQLRITNNPRRILYFSTRLVQPRNRANNSTLQNICQARNILKAHAPRPLVNHLHEAESRP